VLLLLLLLLQVQRYLLSNLRYWLDEFQFDGFRCG
jgi:1,4-alpha-glucan branching enzyme